MKKKLFAVLVITAILLTAVGQIAAVNTQPSYEQARRNKDLRPAYLEALLEKYPPPVEEIDMCYVPKYHDKATMSVNYIPHYIEIESPPTMNIYSSAFEEYENEDDFISTIHHEYNHLRAMERDSVLDNEKHYMEVTKTSEIKLSQQKLENLKSSSRNPENYLALEWADLYDWKNYNSHLISEEFEGSSNAVVTHFIHNHALEMLAIEEEIWLSKNKLNLSDKFEKSRYDMYTRHYLDMIEGLTATGASSSLKNSLEAIFYRDWIEIKIDIKKFIKKTGHKCPVFTLAHPPVF